MWIIITTMRQPFSADFWGNSETQYPANISLFRVNNKSNRKRREICSKITIKVPERLNDVFLVFLLLTLSIFRTFF